MNNATNPQANANGVGSPDWLGAKRLMSEAGPWAVNAQLTGRSRLARYYAKKLMLAAVTENARKAPNDQSEARRHE